MGGLGDSDLHRGWRFQGKRTRIGRRHHRIPGWLTEWIPIGERWNDGMEHIGFTILHLAIQTPNQSTKPAQKVSFFGGQMGLEGRTIF